MHLLTKLTLKDEDEDMQTCEDSDRINIKVSSNDDVIMEFSEESSDESTVPTGSKKSLLHDW